MINFDDIGLGRAICTYKIGAIWSLASPRMHSTKEMSASWKICVHDEMSVLLDFNLLFIQYYRNQVYVTENPYIKLRGLKTWKDSFSPASNDWQDIW